MTVTPLDELNVHGQEDQQTILRQNNDSEITKHTIPCQNFRFVLNALETKEQYPKHIIISSIIWKLIQ